MYKPEIRWGLIQNRGLVALLCRQICSFKVSSDLFVCVWRWRYHVSWHVSYHSVVVHAICQQHCQAGEVKQPGIMTLTHSWSNCCNLHTWALRLLKTFVKVKFSIALRELAKLRCQNFPLRSVTGSTRSIDLVQSGNGVKLFPPAHISWSLSWFSFCIHLSNHKPAFLFYFLCQPFYNPPPPQFVRGSLSLPKVESPQNRPTPTNVLIDCNICVEKSLTAVAITNVL